MKEELKREIEEDGIQNTVVYDVYKTSTGLYVSKDICDIYNIGNREEMKYIKEHECYKVTDQEIQALELHSRKEDILLVPNIVTIFDLQLVLSFTVYRDIKHNNRLYILSTLCSKYEVEPISKRTIKGATYCEVTENDIKKIERETLKEKIALKRNMIDMELEDEMKPADYLFIYYFDYKENKSYVRRDMYEFFKSKGIEIEGKPKVIDNKNCYSITENELKEVESKIGYRGVEQLLKPNKELVIPKPVLDYPNQDVLKGVVDNLNNFTNQQREKLKEERKNNKSLIETLLVYQDKNTHKLYIPVSKVGPRDQQTFMIMNKPCYETNFGELEQYSNYKIVIADVYTTEKEKYDIIICNNNGQFYISKDMLEKLGFYIENPHKILVNKEIYEEITEDDIDLIKGKDSESCQINIIIKQIAPKRG